ncbi:small vasohibin-binding protein [Coregonus clupeaformis]|uniref:small vasohibin-binding protein n=1 Tax=Coregonus clupeaformis TaxID=59861 RepID=UPI001E1C4817|nr:small vasohibin-binding protein [Coregonus clupeaformis]XP_041745176.2 small vasohibin-binding protein [Coregonus clupeaformis]XP_041745177.2 small vasohibin-binding protein [Coregonus clupeaformis]
MESACRKDKPKLNSTPTRGDRAKQKSAQQELKQRTEIYALNKVMTELEQQQFEAFCKQMQSQGE